MRPGKVVVLGASGFVGTTLCERLLGDGSIDVTPAIHSAGSAWRLARLGTPLLQLDVRDPDALRGALRGATHVVNCTRGPRSVMVDGLRNVLAACRSEGIGRFVHLSSVLVYGDPPSAESRHEDAAPNPVPGEDSYGALKLEQDRLVEEAAAQGLRAVVLCPPNISGPFSGYLDGIVDALRRGALALAGDGSGPCNLVDVRNLCHAIELALHAPDAACDGRRMFVTDGDEPSWADVVGLLRGLAGVEQAKRIERETLQRLVAAGARSRPASIGSALRHLVSSDVRAALRQDPLLAKLDRAARTGIARIGGNVERKLRRSIEGPLPVRRPDPHAGLAVGLCAQQLRTVRHSPERAGNLLGYRPLVGFERSMADFRAWHRSMRGMDDPFWSLAQLLYPSPASGGAGARPVDSP